MSGVSNGGSVRLGWIIVIAIWLGVFWMLALTHGAVVFTQGRLP